MKRFPVTNPELVDEAHRLALEALKMLPDGVAYLGGSPFAGLGTRNSDIDLFVVRESGEDRANQMSIGDRRVDVETLSLGWLQDTVAAFGNFSLTESDFSDLAGGNLRVCDKLIRFGLGEIVVDDGRLADLKQQVEAVWDDLVNRVIAIHCINVQNAVEDTEGFLAAGDWQPAAVTARRALLEAASAFLAHRGDLYLGHKWVWRRWRRTVGEAWGADLADLIAGVGPQLASVADVTRMLWLAQSIVLAAIGPVEPPPLPRHCDGTLRRDPYAAAVPVTGAILVYRSRKTTVRVSPQGAYLLSTAHGRTRAEAVEATVDGLGRAGYVLGAGDVERYLDILIESGLIAGPGR